MKKIYTEVKLLMGNSGKFNEYKGGITTEEFEMIWDFLDIVWQPDFETKRIDKSAYKEIKKIIEKRNSLIDNL